MKRHVIRLAAVIAILITGASVSSARQSSPTAAANAATYTWSAEFVSLDPAAMTLTVKSPVAYSDAVAELKRFKAGEKVWIAWSGVSDSSDAVRQIRKTEASRRIDENLVLPAELVTTEAPNSYVTIRVKVPAAVPDALKAVKPGEWIIVTSRHRPASEAEAVVAVKPWSQSAT